MSGEPKMQDTNNTIAPNHKCRIPQRMLPGRQRSFPKPKPTEQMFRPKSANRASDDMSDSIKVYSEARSAQPERERLFPAQKSQAPSFKKKTLNDKVYGASANKVGRDIITVPVKQKFLSKATNQHKMFNLPDQETIKKFEDLEIKQDFSDAHQLCDDVEDLFMDSNEEESITSKGDKVMQLKNVWQEKITQFEGMKNELNDRQHAIMEVYASLRNTKQMLTALGQNANLPSTDDLHVMNVANMTPNQLLKLCAETKYQRQDNHQATKNAITIDLKKLSDMPSKLVSTCKQALETRKEFIEWFENLKNQEKGCSKSTLSKKINEFNAENDMLSSSLKSIENEFLREISDFIRTCWNETIALQLRNEDLANELTKLDSLNSDLKKQIGNFEHQKSYTNKVRVEALEKELKEEKMRRITMKDRLSRAEGQIRINEERASLLESALNEARAQTRHLERTKQQLQEKNQQLQQELNAELNEVNECLKKNTIHLEEIALAKETLQAEKEELKSKLEELSNHYNEALSNMKHELNNNTANLIDAEKKYNEEMEQKKNFKTTMESQCARLQELELRFSETVQKLQEKESQLDELVNYKHNYEKIKQEVDENNREIQKYKERILEYTNLNQELEKKLQKSYEFENKLNDDINKKTEYIKELEMKQRVMTQQLHENESKTEMYEEQLLTLKSHITKLKEHFGEFENLNNLHELINKQNSMLNDTRHKQRELLTEVEKKEETLKSLNETIIKQKELIKEKQDILVMLSKKQEEQTSIVQLNEQIVTKNTEIETLIINVESKKDQINQLERIILTLEDHNRKASIQKRRDQDKIQALEKRINEYERCIAYKSKKIPSDDLDNIIKILEDELGTQFESEVITTDTNHNENMFAVYNYGQNQSSHHNEKEKIPTKMAKEMFIKKNYILCNNNEKYNVDNLSRTQAIAKFDTRKWTTSIDIKNAFPPESKFNNDRSLSVNEKKQFQHPKEKFTNTKYIEFNQACDQKKDKMFKFASHQII